MFPDWLIQQAAKPAPLRVVLLRKFLRRLPVGSFETRMRVGAISRPNYAMCLYYAALEAKSLGYSSVTAVELGVAGGNGLVCMCEHAELIRRKLGIEISVTGFDSGTGLPDTSDSRDLKYYWPAGAFPMDHRALQERLAGRAELRLGPVTRTCAEWEPPAYAPLGAVIFDLDMYSSTMAAFSLLEKANVLPRIWCYFDDLVDRPESALTDKIGEGAAIADFNRMPQREILGDHLGAAHVFGGWPPDPWHDQIYIYHRMGHPLYNSPTFVRDETDQLQLR